MKTKQLLLSLCLGLMLSMSAKAQLADFEDISLPPNSFKNGSDFSGGYVSGGALFTNMYDTTFGPYWEGFAISNMKDTLTKGYQNQYSAITGNTNTYAVMYANGKIILGEAMKSKPIKGFYITNSTYAYYDMKEGSAFSKKFGGSSGNDSDYFRVIISAWKNGGNPADTSIEVYLADFRSKDNSKDYILKTWSYVNLEMFGMVDSFSFYFESSDTGAFGINTPQYLCLDNFGQTPVGILQAKQNVHLGIYPNPVKDILHIDFSETFTHAYIHDLNGRLLLDAESRAIDISQLPAGIYILHVQGTDGTENLKFIKE